MLGDTESEASWSEFFSSLKGRGLRGVDLITSDDHGGLVRAVRQQLWVYAMAAMPDSLHAKCIRSLTQKP
ncbi:transposase [Paenibacillus larvae]|nr:transposase [Paenibacillus larvae]MDT2265455.1 transposase [Paenibacillus larvae]